MRISLDVELNRASFAPRALKNTHEMNVILSNSNQCWNFNAFFRGLKTEIFQPMIVEAKFEPAKKIPVVSEDFCASCVVLDPREPNSAKTKIKFKTGCAADRCVPDLKVVGVLMATQPLMLGTMKTLAITYKISNFGEPAYFTQLKVSIPTDVTQFAKIPPTCIRENNKRDLICDISAGKPFAFKEKIELEIILETSRLDGESLTVLANVSSAGDERRQEDNVFENFIALAEHSKIEIVG